MRGQREIVGTAAGPPLLALLATAPLPIGLASCGYNLFDLGFDARRWAARLLFYLVAAGVTTAVVFGFLHLLGSPGVGVSPLEVLPFVIVGMWFADVLRRSLLARIESSLAPIEERLREIQSRYEHGIRELRDEADAARLIREALDEALAPRDLAVFVWSDQGFRPIAAKGKRAMLSIQVAEAAADRIGERLVLQLSGEGAAGRTDGLADRGLELVAALRLRSRRLGLVLVGGRCDGAAYNRGHLRFLAEIARRGAVALANARVAEELVLTEQRALGLRTAVGLAHDLGKELDWIRRLAIQLPERLGDTARAARDLETIACLAEDLGASVRGFVLDARAPFAEQSGQSPLGAIIDRVVRDWQRRHPDAGSCVTVAPGARDRLVPRRLDQVIANLMDNAALATPARGPVHVQGGLAGGMARICVRDFGPGLDEEGLRRVFEAGYTTRSEGEGSGLGLALARETLRSLGGSIRLERAPGRGLRAVVEVPCRGRS